MAKQFTMNLIELLFGHFEQGYALLPMSPKSSTSVSLQAAPAILVLHLLILSKDKKQETEVESQHLLEGVLSTTTMLQLCEIIKFLLQSLQLPASSAEGITIFTLDGEHRRSLLKLTTRNHSIANTGIQNNSEIFVDFAFTAAESEQLLLCKDVISDPHATIRDKHDARKKRLAIWEKQKKDAVYEGEEVRGVYHSPLNNAFSYYRAVLCFRKTRKLPQLWQKPGASTQTSKHSSRKIP